MFLFIKSKEMVFSIKWIFRYAEIRRTTYTHLLLGKSLLFHNGQSYSQKRLGIQYYGIKLGQIVFTKFTPIPFSQTKQKKKMRHERRMRRKHKK